MIPSLRTRLRLKVTPAFAIAGVPRRLWTSMPIIVARIRGLNIPIPGIWRSMNAPAAMAPVSASPGRMAVTASRRGGLATAWAGLDMGQFTPDRLINPTDHYYDNNLLYRLVGGGKAASLRQSHALE